MSKVRKAIDNLGKDNPMREQIESAISEFLESLPPIGDMEIPSGLREHLVRLSDSTAKARSYVARDRHGDIQYLPKPEVGTRLGKELGKLLLALAAVRGKAAPDDKDFATVQRVAQDCLPPNRCAIIHLLWGARKPLKQAEMVDATGLPQTTVSRTLNDLAVLGVVAKDGDNWKLVRNAVSD